MGSMNQALSATTVKAFRGCAVVAGVVVVTDSDMVAHLNATYPEATVCSVVVAPGEALMLVAPSHYKAIKIDYQLELQGELQSQLANGNDVDIEFH